MAAGLSGTQEIRQWRLDGGGGGGGVVGGAVGKTVAVGIGGRGRSG